MFVSSALKVKLHEKGENYIRIGRNIAIYISRETKTCLIRDISCL
jgi:hypothetical protein